MPEIGDVIDSRWEIYEKLTDDSGQGITFIATDKNDLASKQKCVIKLLKNHDEKSVARFKQEIQAGRQLDHPNILKIVDASSKHSETPYLVTEFCAGRELTSDKISNLSLVQRLRMFRAICDAIGYAHSQKIAHRDIKPRNILFRSEKSLTPLVCDFGLSFLKTDETMARLTATREAWGNWEFRPPEADIGRVDSGGESADVYMLGKLLYWFLSNGQVLVREYFDRTEFDLRKKSDAHIVHFAYDVMKRSIAENPANRYPSAVEMLADVKELVRFEKADARYLDCRLKQSCAFCHIGTYQWRLAPATFYDNNDAREKFNYRGARFYGLAFDLDQRTTNVSTHPIVLIGRCSDCGNIQHFRLDSEFNYARKWANLPKPD
jgi:serine/threonine protein kinase